MISTSGFI